MDARNPDPNAASPRPVKSTNEARQGITGQNVRVVLFSGLGAVVVIFAVIWLLFFGR